MSIKKNHPDRVGCRRVDVRKIELGMWRQSSAVTSNTSTQRSDQRDEEWQTERERERGREERLGGRVHSDD